MNVELFGLGMWWSIAIFAVAALVITGAAYFSNIPRLGMSTLLSIAVLVVFCTAVNLSKESIKLATSDKALAEATEKLKVANASLDEYKAANEKLASENERLSKLNQSQDKELTDAQRKIADLNTSAARGRLHALAAAKRAAAPAPKASGEANDSGPPIEPQGGLIPEADRRLIDGLLRLSAEANEVTQERNQCVELLKVD